ncbi:DUF3696 domain-containing protein [Shinella sp.]|uniref:DUF3696 domain-containing protein n=1 Tax=Shinella sp. TaxID=1870904 RepID=UPI004035FA73
MTRNADAAHLKVELQSGEGQRQMFRFGVKNMRRLKDVPPIELKPITVLVGRNSSGKSTFLRTFPLIRQSINTRTSSPILWYGDLVDFGQYSSVVSGGDEQEKITLSFGLDQIYATSSNSFVIEPTWVRRKNRIKKKVDIDLVISGEANKTMLEGFSLAFDDGGCRFDVSIGHGGELSAIKLNDRDVFHLFGGVDVRFALGSLFPELVVRVKAEGAERYFWYNETNWASSLIQKHIRGHIDKRIGNSKVNIFVSQLLDMDAFTNDNIQALEKNVGQGSFRKLLSDVRGKNSNHLREILFQIYETAAFLRLLPSVFGELRDLLSKSLYIGPVRARSERYYRYQDLSVSEIDPDGKNFPMFLNSLRQHQRDDFSDWVQRQFGYGVDVRSESGHISILLKFGADTSNIVDNGYGISQVLPVLGQIWWASRGKGTQVFPSQQSDGATIVIEQPELHLHPAHQALLADAIVGERNADTPDDARIKFIVETHSEALVNRLGQLVADGVVPHGDVQVLVFEDDKEQAVTTVRISPFDEHGVLQNWPFGFFQPEV